MKKLLCISVCLCMAGISLPLQAQTISDYIFSVELTQGIDYGYPNQNDTAYDFHLYIETDTSVKSIGVVCPGGASFEITQTDMDNGVIETDFDDEGDLYEWEYNAEFPTFSSLAQYGDGDYIITVNFESIPSVSTGVSFNDPATSGPIPQPIQEPVSAWPVNGSTVESPVLFQWQPVIDSNVNFLHLLLYSRYDDSEVEQLLDPDQTQWGPYSIPNGLYEVEIAFANAYFLTDGDGIELLLVKYTESDHEFMIGSEEISVSGIVIDKHTRLPVAGVTVGYWHDYLQQWKQTYTSQQGNYILQDLAPGTVEIKVLPNPGSSYAEIGRRIELTGSVSGLDFELPAEAIVSGRVIDSDNAVGIADVEVIYWNEEYVTWKYTLTDQNGNFIFSGMPPGYAYFDIIPSLDSGYAQLPEDISNIYLKEGRVFANRYFALEKGARVQGRAVDFSGNPFSNVEVSAGGMKSDHDYDTDHLGRYEINLPVGKYNIVAETYDMEGSFGSTSHEIEVDDISQVITVPDIVVYTSATGDSISGTAVISSDAVYDGVSVVLLPAGTMISTDDPDSWYTVRTTAETEPDQYGNFEIKAVPPGDYDVLLAAFNEIGRDMESIAILDTVFNVPAGADNISLNFNTLPGKIEGTVLNSYHRPVTDAVVILVDESAGEDSFMGFSDSDIDGNFEIFNVPEGQYTIAAIHSQYGVSSSSVEVTSGQVTDYGNLVIPFNTVKKAADLTGDGTVDIHDLLLISEHWLGHGDLPQSLQSGYVNMFTLARFAEFWMHQAAWLR